MKPDAGPIKLPAMDPMSDDTFDQALISAAFRVAATRGWAGMTIVEAARDAGLPLDEVRARFSGKRALLIRFGVLLDRAALLAATQNGPVREQLFDLLMSRFDTMKPHREGIRALLRHLPADPGLALILLCETRRAMRWMLEAAGQPVNGVRGLLRIKGLTAVWTWTMRAFERDTSDDLSATMASLDQALGRAHDIALFLSGSSPAPDELATDGPAPDGPATDASAVPEANSG